MAGPHDEWFAALCKKKKVGQVEMLVYREGKITWFVIEAIGPKYQTVALGRGRNISAAQSALEEALAEG